MALYSEKVMDHFMNPRNVGEIEDASGVGTVGNAKCGDIMRIFLDIDENTHIINDVRVIGGCSGNLQGVSSLLKGMKAEEAISRMSGIKCGYKNSSCPDQISEALTEALAKMEK